MVVLHVRRNKSALWLGGTSLALYAGVAQIVTGPEQTREWLFGYVLAWGLYMALFAAARDDDFVGSPWLLVGWALVARLLLVGTNPWLSDDLYRYLLDGRVLAEGINPFRWPPSDPRIQSIAPVLAARVNHPDVPTIYPALAQIVALGAALLRLDIVGWRVLISAIDVFVMLAVWRLFGRGVRGWRAAAVYGLCPLAIWESGANGHLEPLAALPLLWAARFVSRGSPVRGGLLLGAAAMAKLYPLLLLPLWLRERGFWRFAGVALLTTAAGLVPFMLGGVDIFEGLRTYLGRWSFNSPLYSFLAALTGQGDLLRALPFVVVLLAGIVAARREEDPVRMIPLLLFAFLVIGPTLHPWYALWLLPWLGDRPHPGHWSFVAAMGGAYAVWWSVAQSGEWVLPVGVPELLWSIVAIGWLAAVWKDEGQTPEAI
jgi:hypothetical protein